MVPMPGTWLQGEGEPVSWKWWSTLGQAELQIFPVMLKNTGDVQTAQKILDIIRSSSMDPVWIWSSMFFEKETKLDIGWIGKLEYHRKIDSGQPRSFFAKIAIHIAEMLGFGSDLMPTHMAACLTINISGL